jgi:hypothetical protein
MNKKQILIEKLKTKDPKSLKVIVGFDGFVDEIIHVVDKRIDSDQFVRLETIMALAKRIGNASGLSTNIELYPVVQKIGGNGPIMCNALAMHEVDMTYIGALGKPNVHEVFMPMTNHSKLFTMAASGHTDALEFDDGKLMFGKMESLKDVNYENLISAVGKDHFIGLLDEVDLLATVNWSMLVHMTSIWEKMHEECLPKMQLRSQKPIFFVDLADPEKREPEEITKALHFLRHFKDKFFVVLGLNKKEAYDVADVLNLFDSRDLKAMSISLEQLNLALYRQLDLDAIVIHPVDRSTVVVDGVFYEESGPYVKKPKLTTGAGDNFNAGFNLGCLLGLNPDEALLLGMATSGFYVRQARSPKYEELIEFLSEWDQGLV